mmetsp:Transcript_82774/g.146198  ORF Transcript_82774/g.146198 Transcript_82774/m.146198 type:complete len:397 (+) Transcript_82774:76-1266(+)
MRQARKARQAADLAAAEDIKLRWLSLSRELQLAALRFTDRDVVARASYIQKMLHSSEIACYQNGVNLKFDQAGQPIVSTGLVHFKFEFGQTEPELPVAVSATSHLLELPDFFGYLVARLGSLFGGPPVLRHNDLVSALEPAPNSWTEFETQLLRLVSLRIYQHGMADGGSRNHAEPRGGEGAPDPQIAQELENLELLASQPSSRKKRSSRKRGNHTSNSTAGASVSLSVEDAEKKSPTVAEPEVQEPEQTSVGATEQKEEEEEIEEELAPEAGNTAAVEDLASSSWTQVWRKARKPSAGIPSASSNCSTTSGHSRNSSLMTEASKESVEVQLECEEPEPDTLEKLWVPSGSPGHVEEWFSADSTVRACIKLTFWEVEQTRSARPIRTRSLDAKTVP